MAGRNITLMGASYQNVPGVKLPQTGGGEVYFVDTSDTSCSDVDVRVGELFYNDTGTPCIGSYVWSFIGDNAELVEKIVDTEIALADTNFATWTPSTTASVIRSGSSVVESGLQMSSYDFLIRWRCMFEAAYKDGATLKAQVFKEGAEIWQALYKRPNNLSNIEAGTFNQNTNTVLQTASLNVYYNITGTKAAAYNVSYGIYPSAVAATFSNTTAASPNVTIYQPHYYARCNATYFATGRASELDQDNSRIRIVGELYRSRPGAAMRSIYGGLIDLFNASSK